MDDDPKCRALRLTAHSTNIERFKKPTIFEDVYLKPPRGRMLGNKVTIQHALAGGSRLFVIEIDCISEESDNADTDYKAAPLVQSHH